MPDLWPNDFGTLQMTPPIVILREQAEIISTKTGGKIVGQVQTRKHGEGFAHVFNLVAPLLDDYTYRLVVVTHTVHLYPAEVHVDLGNKTYLSHSPGELENELRTLFSSEQTKRVIAAILAQVDAVQS